MSGVIASVHLADVGVGRALGIVRKVPKPGAGSIPGRRSAHVAIPAPFAERRKPPMLGRAGLIAFWDDHAALDRFFGEHPLAAKLAGGFSVRLDPLRAFGSWPGLPDDVPRSR